MSLRIHAHFEHLRIQTINSIYDSFSTDLDSKHHLRKKLLCGKDIGLEVIASIIIHANVFKRYKRFAAFTTDIYIRSFRRTI